MKALEYMAMLVLGSLGGYLVTRYYQRKNVKQYLTKLMKTWVLGPSPKKVPIKKLAILSIEASRYIYGQAKRDYVTPATEVVKDVANELEYDLTKKQWSKVRIEARKLVRKPKEVSKELSKI